MSIRIIEIFVRLREMLILYKDVAILIEQIEDKLGKRDQKIELLFNTSINLFTKKKARVHQLVLNRIYKKR